MICILSISQINLHFKIYSTPARDMFKVHQMVLAQCQNFPYWPGKIQKYNPIQNTYNVLFVGEKSHADVSALFVIPFSEQECRKLLAEGSNRNNKNLVHSIKLAIKKLKRREKNLDSSQSDDFYERESNSKIDMEIEYPKKVKVVQPPPPKQTEDPASQMVRHFETLMKDLVEPCIGEKHLPNSEKQPIVFQKNAVLSADDEHKLKNLIQSNVVPLHRILDLKIIEKMIMLIKVYQNFKIWCTNRQQIMEIIEKKYGQYKMAILNENALSKLDLPNLRKDQILHKVTHFKACM